MSISHAQFIALWTQIESDTDSLALRNLRLAVRRRARLQRLASALVIGLGAFDFMLAGVSRFFI